MRKQSGSPFTDLFRFRNLHRGYPQAPKLQHGSGRCGQRQPSRHVVWVGRVRLDRLPQWRVGRGWPRSVYPQPLQCRDYTGGTFENDGTRRQERQPAHADSGGGDERCSRCGFPHPILPATSLADFGRHELDAKLEPSASGTRTRSRRMHFLQTSLTQPSPLANACERVGVLGVQLWRENR